MKANLTKLILIVVLTVIVVFAYGPTVEYLPINGIIRDTQLSIETVETYLENKEDTIKNLKPNNRSRLIWIDSIPRQTDYVLCYLHGFSASPQEGDPGYRLIAKKYGFNLFVPLLAGHGLDDPESFLHLTPKELIDSAKEALAICKLLGKKTILMSSSTGSTLSAYLAAENPDFVDALIMYSPNIDLQDQTSELLTLPWGLSLAKMVLGGDYNYGTLPPPCFPYWTMQYRVEGLVALKTLIEETMTVEIYNKINQPLMLGYYYKNDEEKDHTISINEAKYFFENVRTPENQKKLFNFPEVGAHVMLSDLTAKDMSQVLLKTEEFIENTLKIFPL